MPDSEGTDYLIEASDSNNTLEVSDNIKAIELLSLILNSKTL